MKQKYLKTHILLRRGTLQEWERVNPVLGPGQMGVALDVGRCKIGNGNTAWNDLPFFVIMPDLVDYAMVVAKTEQEWQEDSHVISKQGQIYVYLKNNENDKIVPAKIKIGDGKAYIVDLPFVTDAIQALLDDHIHDLNIHTSLQEKEFWNNKINITFNNEGVVDNVLIFNRN